MEEKHQLKSWVTTRKWQLLGAFRCFPTPSVQPVVPVVSRDLARGASGNGGEEEPADIAMEERRTDHMVDPLSTAMDPAHTLGVG